MDREQKALETAIRARKIVKERLFGVLATHSKAMPGYPFGSLVQYMIANDGGLLLYISKLAQHTRNVLEDTRVSLTVVEDSIDVQQAGRVTLLGQLTPVKDENALLNQYFRFFPESQHYQDNMHDFHLYRLDIEKVRFIGGFGDINWVSRENFCVESSFKCQEKLESIKHMNDSHQDALIGYCKLFNIHFSQGNQIEMVDFDHEGMWLSVEHRKHYISFGQAIYNTAMLRAVLVALAKKARAADKLSEHKTLSNLA
ncbi:HugZ family protein [Fangia hongkongensis]|uniref:HugZ family pyridoxamine 5'-phosphate oxidase n=2 Tax=Fangia hongkongensis TaxID=270495 RepID=UPI00037D1D22|nr:DUF2470 domain-containing protein [Fangia hongkongensis]